MPRIFKTHEDCDFRATCAPQINPDVTFLTGGWELACYLDTDLPPGLDPVYRKVVVSFNGGATGVFRSEFSAYSTQDCTGPAIASDSGTLIGTYILGADILSDDGLMVSELDLMSNEIQPLDGQSISPVVDGPLDLTIAYLDGEFCTLELMKTPT